MAAQNEDSKNNVVKHPFLSSLLPCGVNIVAIGIHVRTTVIVVLTGTDRLNYIQNRYQDENADYGFSNRLSPVKRI